MKIAFQSNTICHRGTTVAILDYAKYNEEILGNESIIVYPLNFSDSGVSLDSLTQKDVLEEVSRQFPVFGYSSLAELDKIVIDNNVDATYFIKGGFNDGVLTTKSKNLVHAVFQANQPHGDRYAYISEWLSNHVSDGKIDYVPHIVDLPKTIPNRQG